MSKQSYLLAIGVMTGNSLDGCDVVLSRFDEDGKIQDLKSHTLASPPELTQQLQALRSAVNECGGNMELVAKSFVPFDTVQKRYVEFVGQTVAELKAEASKDENIASHYDLTKIDLIGFHGQTCAHFPPSIAKTSDPSVVYTVQVGDGQMLADITGTTVVYDFRSDDLMNGGEAAPLAPIHHQHLAEDLRRRGSFPVAFCNAGNTGNFTIISVKKSTAELYVAGWDVGPFNNYPDKLMQSERQLECDFDGQHGKRGSVNLELLRKLFETAVITKDGHNFLLVAPPKSSDPQWYRIIPELAGTAAVGGAHPSFEDRLRTAEYFAAYIYVYALSMIPADIEMPLHYALCGGGWKNPIPAEHFSGLLLGDFTHNPVLEEHRKVFTLLGQRMANSPTIDFSDKYGFDGTAMEARILADAAVCRLKGEPFTRPTTTGVRIDTVCGRICFPDRMKSKATANVRQWLDHFHSLNLTVESEAFDSRWSRGSAGWYQRAQKGL